MKRRQFLTYAALAGGSSLWSLSNAGVMNFSNKTRFPANEEANELRSDVVIIGGGFGGCAAALAACHNGLNVIMTEKTDWIGGQVSQQGVPLDEYPWIETHNARCLKKQLFFIYLIINSPL